MDKIEKIYYSVKKFEDSKDKDFINALKIYNDSISVETKTDTNEIIYFADNNKIQENRTMYFLGLYIANEIIGYVEAAYLKKTKTIVIDYIVIKDEYHLNSVFYPLFGLIQKFFSDELIDYDYMVTEVSTKCIKDIDSESYFTKKMLQLEDFRIANQLYIQPKLGINNKESNFEFQLLIRSKHALSTIKSETYLAIVKDIYYEHYYAWYAQVDPTNKEIYKKHIDDQYERISNIIKKSDNVTFENCNYICEFYKASDCHYNTSTAGFVKKAEKNRPLLLLLIPAMVIIEIIFSVIILNVLNKKGIDVTSFTPILTAITSLFTCVFTLAFTRIGK